MLVHLLRPPSHNSAAISMMRARQKGFAVWSATKARLGSPFGVVTPSGQTAPCTNSPPQLGRHISLVTPPSLFSSHTPSFVHRCKLRCLKDFGTHQETPINRQNRDTGCSPTCCGESLHSQLTRRRARAHCLAKKKKTLLLRSIVLSTREFAIRTTLEGRVR